LITDRELVEKYEIEPETWANITKNRELIHALRDERARRVRSSVAAREKAAGHFVRAPDVLGAILDDTSASPRHRIDSANTLRQTAHGDDDTEKTADAGEKFIITINLGEDHIERYEKELKPMKPVVPIEDKSDE